MRHNINYMDIKQKPLTWLHGAVKSPPFSAAARLEAGFLLRLLQLGNKLALPHSRPMPSIGIRCHELRINDERVTWPIVYRIDLDAILILDVFKKKTTVTPKRVIDMCKERMRSYGHESK